MSEAGSRWRILVNFSYFIEHCQMFPVKHSRCMGEDCDEPVAVPLRSEDVVLHLLALVCLCGHAELSTIRLLTRRRRTFTRL
jgi:hypothetical protein